MKGKPILFSPPMVRAILEGRKTQTRRILKPQPGNNNRIPGKDGTVINISDPRTTELCKYGQPGDRLWVRETFRILGSGPGEKIPKSGNHDMVQYFADNDESYIDRYRPSIHMPRWASRINLEITSVRVERLQEISEADSIAEGLTDCGGAWSISTAKMISRCVDPRETFRDLWSNINGPGSWTVNPYVWVVEFKRI